MFAFERDAAELARLSEEYRKYAEPTGRVAQGHTVWTTLNGGRTWTPDHFKYS
jgi:hypothetical protein